MIDLTDLFKMKNENIDYPKLIDDLKFLGEATVTKGQNIITICEMLKNIPFDEGYPILKSTIKIIQKGYLDSLGLKK